MKNRGIIIGLIVFLSLLCVSLISGMIILMNKDIGFSFGLTRKTRIVDTFELHTSKVSELDFNLYSADVEIKEIDDDMITVDYYSDKETDKIISLDNGHIVVNEENSKIICLGICLNSRKVVAYVPKDYIGSYNIVTRSGDVKFNVDAIENNIDIKTTSGDVRLKNTGYANVKTTSGNIEIEDTTKAKLQSTSGDIAVKGKANVLSVNTTSGDIKTNKISKSMDLSSTSGSILVDTLSITDDSSISAISGDIKINDNASNCYIEYNTVSGSNHIEKSDRKSDIVLKVSTISGDIRVN